MEEQEYTQPVRRRRKKKQSILTAAPLLICVIVMGVVYLLTGCFGLNNGTGNPPNVPEAESLQSAEPAPAVPSDAAPSEAELPTESGENPDGTAETPVEPSEVPTTAPQTEAPRSFTSVDASYFDDALFIGDSRTNGLQIYDPPSPDTDYYCSTSMTIFGLLDSSESLNGEGSVIGLTNVLQNKQYGKVYLMLGINECGYDTGAFIDAYRKVVETVRANQPDAVIYIQSILYVTQDKEAAMPVFASSVLDEKNAELKKLANDSDIFYLEVNDALNDGTNHLPADYTGDGVHLKASCYKYWKEYLYNHAIVKN